MLKTGRKGLNDYICRKFHVFMPMRAIGALGEKDWAKLMAMMEEGQTEGQRKIMEEAREIGKRFKTTE